MILNISNSKKIVLLFSIIHFLFSIQANAQTTPTGIDLNNLSNVKVDELTDDQIKTILNQGGANGITLEQGIEMAKQRKLPATEIEKLKLRVANINKTNPATAVPTDAPAAIITQKNEAEGKAAEAEAGKLDAKKAVDPKGTIYGQQYFRNADIKIFDRSIDAKAPANYVIGVGDEFGISVYGYSYYNEVLKVDSRGAITPTQMGPIFVKGLTFEKAKALIKAKMNQYFDLKNNTLDVTLAYSRSISVNIVGEVLKPGSYKMPALNTAFNALILAGGPNDIGTLRNIQIRRDGKVIKTLDVYAFLFDPNSKLDFYLEDNDYILVSNSTKLVSISGQVNRSTLFELTDKEGVFSLIKYAGGLQADAYKEKVQVVRRSSLESKIIDVNIDSLAKIGKDFKLENGDAVIVKSANSDVLNKITIRGAVNFAGDYNLAKNDKISDLIKKAGGLKSEANLESAYLIRTKQDQTKDYIRLNLKELVSNAGSAQNLVLQALDVLTIYSNKDYIEPFGVQVYGAVRKEGSYDFVSGMTLGDVLQNAGGLKIEAENLRIEISRLNYFNENYTDGQDVRVLVEKIKLSSNQTFLAEAEAQIKLQPFDQVFVRTVPNFELQRNITISGEVKYPGVYSLTSKDERIDDVIKRAGGLTKFAFPESSTLFRPSLPGGFIVMNLKSALKSHTNKYNYALREGDVLTIPTVNDYVTIQGSTVEYLNVLNKNQVNAPYVTGRRAKYYINEFGNGFTKDSWRKKTYVVQPNAKINRTKDFYVFKIYPKVTKGSTIYVVQKIKKEKELKKEREPFNWNSFIENTTLKVTGIITLVLLFQRL